jgi:Zn finger protein HypA/HybF involved in hydrogenase expression
MNKLRHWITQLFLRKHVCAWCRPQRWIGGNPFSKQLTHGICPACRERQIAIMHERRSQLTATV